MNRRDFLKMPAIAVAGAPLVALGQAQYPYAIRHTKGTKPCGQLAFRLSYRPKSGDRFVSSKAAAPDGGPIRPQSSVRCLSCGSHYIGAIHTGDVEFVGLS